MSHAAATRWRIFSLLLGLAPLAAAQDVVWDRSCRFIVEVDGRPDPAAELYERRGVADLVGRLPDDSWFLVRPAQQRVHALAPGSVERRETGMVLLAEPTDSGKPLTHRAGLTFDVAGRWLRIIPTPALLGRTTPEQFLGMCPTFQAREEAYEPDSEALAQIASCDRDLTLEIYFGSWCPHCQEVLPKLFKCLRLADNDRLKVQMIGLPRQFGAEKVVQDREIRGVPTVIIFEGGAEVGRFSGTEKVSVETTLASMVGG